MIDKPPLSRIRRRPDIFHNCFAPSVHVVSKTSSQSVCHPTRAKSPKIPPKYCRRPSVTAGLGPPKVTLPYQIVLRRLMMPGHLCCRATGDLAGGKGSF
ncbi:hypothetical protein BJ508DRAFT_165045 [Ascobolus immersus RN42]|uniref:Uncharacterized protein n=1 Tax=Ascobolus immersus RN42 TaxID=1160509 RepID=A0A3N4HWW6_ASCIM|nr:hypothetical protein BJ508DRAFT_165045 [Ascobolus immersus RN42]